MNAFFVMRRLIFDGGSNLCRQASFSPKFCLFIPLKACESETQTRIDNPFYERILKTKVSFLNVKQFLMFYEQADKDMYVVSNQVLVR